MAEHLVFTLYGPLQAWGSVAVGELRPCAGHPTRSGMLGLLAAALGIRRGEDDRLRALSDGYGVAVRVDDPGDRFTDYHTAQVPSHKNKRAFHSRRDELGGKLAPHEALNTILSRRDYLADARFTACLRPWNEGVSPSLQELLAALERPKLTPYLGRKSCPPGLPFLPRIVRAEDALGALAAYYPYGEQGGGAAPDGEDRQGDAQRRGGVDRPHWRGLRRGNAGDVFCDEGMCAGNPLERLTIRDMLDDHARRAFGTRRECRYNPETGRGGA